MLKIYDPSDVTNVIPFPIEDDKRYVTHKYDGYDTLTFEIASNDPLYSYIVEEVKIEDESNRYVIKKIDEHSDFVTVVCDIDLDDWKSEVFRDFRTTNTMLIEVLQIIVPDGWQIIGAGQFSKRTTIEESEGEPFRVATAMDILSKSSEVYSCVFNFNAVKKTIEAIDPTTFKASGDFFTDELNLKNLGYVGNSTEFATRLYAFGKKDEEGNPLTFESINGGKPYVEDYTYSDKIISVGWSDERYDVAENLLEAAKSKLKQLSHPVRSYTCEAKNITGGAWLYKIVTLIDRRRKTRVEHQIVEYKEYPDHSLDSITLSMTAPKIESQLGKVQNDLKEELKNQNSSIQQIIQDAINHATEMITGNKGGHFVWIMDEQGRPMELVNLGDTDDINTAKSVWRWNASGLGHSSTGYDGQYTLAILADGSINADTITSGIMNANLIRAGKLTDLKGLNYWDLETGEFKLSFDDTYFDDKTLDDILDDKMTQQEIFNTLTNNGQSKGIIMKDGQLYINATYLSTGVLASKDGETFYLDLDNGILRLKASELTIAGKTVGAMIDDAVSNLDIDTDIELTQENVFKALTNNGQSKGIYLKDGELYINATYLGTGAIFDSKGNKLIDLSAGTINLNGQVSANGNFKINTDGKIEAVEAKMKSVYIENGLYTFTSYKEDFDCPFSYIDDKGVNFREGNKLYGGIGNSAYGDGVMIDGYPTLFFVSEELLVATELRASNTQFYKGRTGLFSFGTSTNYRFVNGLLVEEV